MSADEALTTALALFWFAVAGLVLLGVIHRAVRAWQDLRNRRAEYAERLLVTMKETDSAGTVVGPDGIRMTRWELERQRCDRLEARLLAANAEVEHWRRLANARFTPVVQDES
jgi:hypothetical protein